MLKNNIEVDVKVKCIEAETTQAKLAEDAQRKCSAYLAM